VATIPDATTDSGLMSWDDIAQHLGISRTEVQRNYKRAILKVRAEMLKSGVSAQEFTQYLLHRFSKDAP